MLGGKAQVAMQNRSWLDAIGLFEAALQKLTAHPESLLFVRLTLSHKIRGTLYTGLSRVWRVPAVSVPA